MDFLKAIRTKESLVFEAVLTTVFGKHCSYRLSFTKNKKTNSTSLLKRLAAKCNVEVEYNVTKLDGSDFERTERNEVTRDEIKAF